jgi:fluoroacetyl-CoA thioesterase
MNDLDKVAIGMTAEKTVTVTSEMTVGHFVANMLRVYATPMMILLMEMPSAPRSPRICRRASSASAWT